MSADPLYAVIAKHNRQFNNCKECPLHAHANRYVFVRGSWLRSDTRPLILFIGEAPGVTEDRLGIPFVGPIGEVFDQYIAGLRERLGGPFPWIATNAIACIPFSPTKLGGIKKPTNNEMIACSPRLIDLIKRCRPHNIVTLGRTAREHLEYLGIPHVAIWHPAYILRCAGNPELLRSALDNLATMLVGKPQDE